MTNHQQAFLGLHTEYMNQIGGIPIYVSPHMVIKKVKPMPSWVYLSWLPNLQKLRKFRVWFVGKKRSKWTKLHVVWVPSRSIIVLPNNQGLVMHPVMKAEMLKHVPL